MWSRGRHAALLRGPEIFEPGGTAFDAIEIMDDDDDSNDDDGNKKPAAIGNSAPKPSPIRDGEVVVLEGPPIRTSQDRRKPPPRANTPPQNPPSPLVRIMEIFPDADIDYVEKKLREQSNKIEVVVAVMSEGEYPKQKNGSLSDTTSGPNVNNTIIRAQKTTEPKHDYSSPAASFDLTPTYNGECMNLLLFDFCFLQKKAIKILLSENQGRYTLTRNFIQDTLVGKSPNPPAAAGAGSAAAMRIEKEEDNNYRLLRSALKRGVIPENVRDRFGGRMQLMKKPRKKIGVSCPAITDPVLMDEHFHYEKRFNEWLDKVQGRMRGQANNELALKDGSAVQCLCCFDDVAISECVSCKENGHLICKECMVQYIESQVFSCGNLGVDKVTKKPALEIKCCDGSGCNSGFRDEVLEKILSSKTWEKYSEMQTKAQIEQAGLGDSLAMCPKCGYQAEVPDTQNNFECPVEGCRFVSCRKCGKASHIPLRCEEVKEKDRQDAGRLKVEEALSEAKMRTCPKCKKKFIKIDGCNKMTCPCGMKMCYVCRTPLNKLSNPYTHFCNTPHCDHSSCGKCKMYSNDEEDDAQAMREAGIAAKEEYEAQLQNDDGVQGASANLNLDVDQMIHDPYSSNSRKRKEREQRAPRRVRHVRGRLQEG